MEIEEFFAKILADFYSTFCIEPRPINIQFEDDIYKKYFQIRPEHKGKISKIREALGDDNGVTVPPSELDGIFTILINQGYAVDCIQNGKFDWIGTLIHEVTHANDYANYAKLVAAVDYDSILDKSIVANHLFHFWTEFNAKAKGYYFLRKYTFRDLYDESQIDFIIQEELPFHYKNIRDLHESCASFENTIYSIVHFLGRVYVWDILFPHYFTDEKIGEIFSSSKMMYDLYQFLKTHDRLEEAYNAFDEMKVILLQDVFDE